MLGHTPDGSDRRPIFHLRATLRGFAMLPVWYYTFIRNDAGMSDVRAMPFEVLNEDRSSSACDGEVRVGDTEQRARASTTRIREVSAPHDARRVGRGFQRPYGR